MKATGIVRRIDDLGRVVIPKEIRRVNRLHEGTPMEIFTDKEGEIILKKYSPIVELGGFAKQYADTLAQTIGHNICISDRDQILACSGPKKRDYAGKAVSKPLENLMMERDTVGIPSGAKNSNVGYGEAPFLPLISSETDTSHYHAQIIVPIVAGGDPIGSISIFTVDPKDKFSELEYKAIICAAAFLGKQMEEI